MKFKIFLFLSLLGFLCSYSQASQKGAISMKDKKTKTEEATLAGGCFWCVESDLEKYAGIIEVLSGYSGGERVNPTYTNYSKPFKDTKHIEVVRVVFDPGIISYSQILDIFWRKMNPTDKDGQFVDRGIEYSSAIFYHNNVQKELAKKSKKELQEKGPFKKGEVITPIYPLKNFYPAEEYHQNYYKKNLLSSAKYKYYRSASGRDQFLKKTWGKFKDFKNLPLLKSEKKDSKKKVSMNSLRDFKSFTKPSKEDLKKKLTALQYKVTQKDGTERAFSSDHWKSKEEGIYVDIVSGEPLFSSKDKYDSGTGWPSFTKPIDGKYIVTKEDRKLLSVRTEVRSKYGDSHLGHVFKDGPRPLGLRYCINSASLQFIPKKELEKQGYKEYIALF